MRREIRGLALAGGSSRRLGQDKAMLSFHNGITQLDYTLKLLSNFCSSIAISGRADQRMSRSSSIDAEFIPDAKGVCGPMAGVIAGLQYAPQLPLLVIATDMPLVDASIVLRLLSQRSPNKTAVCFEGSDGKPEPLCAVYELDALEELERFAKSGNFSLREYLKGRGVERIQFKRSDMLASVNTLEDLERIRTKLSQ